MLAGVLRADRARLRPLVVDTPATAALRAAVRARRDLVAHRIAAWNQLRAHVAAAFPGAVGLFAHLDSQISLAFLARFGSQDAAGQLSEDDLDAWLHTLPYRGNPASPGQLRARLHAAPPGATGADGAARAAITSALVVTLTTLAAQIKALEADIGPQLAAHPDAHIFTSLPRAGTVRAARLLAGTGDCRARFPGPGSRPAWPGSRPSPASPASTSRSGSGGRSIASSAPPSATSPPTPATPAPGPRPSTTPPAPAAKTTRTPSASSPAHGST